MENREIFRRFGSVNQSAARFAALARLDIDATIRAGVGADIARPFALAGSGVQAVRNACRAQRIDPSLGERGRDARAGAA
jgi:hypothetical protein